MWPNPQKIVGIWSHLLKKSLMENFIFCAVSNKRKNDKTTTNSVEITFNGKAPWNKTPAVTRSMNMDIWVVGKSNQLFIRGS